MWRSPLIRASGAMRPLVASQRVVRPVAMAVQKRLVSSSYGHGSRAVPASDSDGWEPQEYRRSPMRTAVPDDNIATSNEYVTPEDDEWEGRAKDVSETLHADVTFDDLNLLPSVKDALARAGFKKPFGVQAEAIPLVLQGHNVLATALTGTGKTLAFGLPIINILESKKLQRLRPYQPYAMVLCPTRELANQVARDISMFTRMPVTSVYGGTSINAQITALRRGTAVVVGTPGRVKDLLERGVLDTSALEMAVLDEADEMLSMGFQQDVATCLDARPADCQMMLFTATLDRSLSNIIHQYMREHKVVDLVAQQRLEVPTNVKHLYYTTRQVKNNLSGVVNTVLNQTSYKRALVFLNTKRECNELATGLGGGARSAVINSDLSQAQRDATMADFRKGRIQVLCATSVMARGIDVPEIDVVIQVEPPRQLEDYIHRSGRTGRAGRDGTSILIAAGNREDRRMINELKHRCNIQKFTVDVKSMAEEIINRAIQDANNVKDHETVSTFEGILSQYLEQHNLDPKHILARVVAAKAGAQFNNLDSQIDEDLDDFHIHRKKHHNGYRNQSNFRQRNGGFGGDIGREMQHRQHGYGSEDRFNRFRNGGRQYEGRSHEGRQRDFGSLREGSSSRRRLW
eukprot:Clim_evm38s150 gene=Clim_evmTU38s150